MFKYHLLVELLICSLFVPPGLESKIGGRMLDGEWEYSWATIISLFSTLKFYLLVRTYDHLSLFMQQNFEALVRKHQFKLTPVFKQKMELKYRPYAYIGWLALSIILYFGYLIRTVEITFQSADGSSFHFTYILDSFWMTMATMTTVGYGDFYPRTHVGRIMAIFSCLIGQFIVSALVVALQNFVSLSTDEERAYSHLKHIMYQDEMKVKAANVIRAALRLSRHKKKMAKKKGLRIVQVLSLFLNLRTYISYFHSKYKSVSSRVMPLDQMIKNLNDRIKLDLDELRQNSFQLPIIEERLNDLRER